MDINQVNQLIRQGEGIQIEFKGSKESIPDSFYETVVSFSNTDGGTILLGVNDQGSVIGVDPNAVVKLKKNIISALNSDGCINPSIFVEPIIVTHPEGLIMVIQILQSSQVHSHAGEIYIRSFESDLKITHEQQKIRDLYIKKSNFFTETNIYPALTIKDLEETLFEKARNLMRSKQSDHPWLSLNNENILRSSGLLIKDFNTGLEGFTLASALIFGKETTIRSIIPAYRIEALVRIHDKDRVDDRLTLQKNLIDSYLELKQFINRYLPDKFYLDGDQRVDLRDKIFREVIGNIIVHREYTNHASTEIIITDTEVVATNPNIPRFHGVINPKEFNPSPKNPNIRKFFKELGWSDELGSGIRNTNKYVALYVTNAKPIFIEDETFKTIIPLVWFTMEKHATHFQLWLGLPEESLPHITKGLSNISLSNESLAENWEDLLLHLISSWSKKDIKLEQLRWSLNQDIEQEIGKKVPSWDQKGAKQITEISCIDEDQILELIKKVPSWDQKGAKLLSKRSLILITILTLTLEPIKLQDILEWMAYKKRQSLREIYLDPLMKVGFVTRTIKDKPKDPEQKYVITESGKLFLAGS